MSVHSSAIIHPRAELGRDITVGPFAVIEAEVQIGDGTTIHSQATIKSGTKIGRNCKVYQGAVVGGDPQDLKFKDEKTYLEIADDVSIREYCTINRGTKATGVTQINKGALIMAYSHVAHDCLIDEYAILANNVQLAGHVFVGVHGIVGGMTAIQQFVKIGDHAFVGGGTLVRKDVPPYIRVAREPLSYIGVNRIGLRRRGFDVETIKKISDIYRVLFVKHSNLSIGLRHAKQSFDGHPLYEEITEFIAKSEKGIVRGFRQMKSDDY